MGEGEGWGERERRGGGGGGGGEGGERRRRSFLREQEKKIDKNWVEGGKTQVVLVVACHPAVSTLSLLSQPTPKKKHKVRLSPPFSPQTRGYDRERRRRADDRDKKRERRWRREEKF